MTFQTTKSMAEEVTKLWKTHHIAAMRVNANNQFCVELHPNKSPGMTHTVAMEIEGVEELLKLGFAARCCFP